MKLAIFPAAALCLPLAGCFLPSSQAGSWGPGGCAPQGPVWSQGTFLPAQGTLLEGWQKQPTGNWICYRQGITIGWFSPATGEFSRMDGQGYLVGGKIKPPWKPCCPACRCPDPGDCRCLPGRACCPECTCGPVPEKKKSADPAPAKDPAPGAPVAPGMGFWPAGGVDRSKLAAHEVYEIGGQAVSRGDAEAALQQVGIPDDSGRLRLTIIGPEPSRKRVVEDLARDPSLAPFQEKFLVQDYDPEDPMVACGFVTSGQPTIYIQEPKGKVLHRQDSYAGPGLLAQAMAEAVRRADPNYHPDQDPNLGQPILSGLGKIPPLAIPLIFLAVVAGIVLIKRNKQ